MRRKHRKAEPYVAPLGAPPLRDVVLDIAKKSKELGALDDKIGDNIRTLETWARKSNVERIFSTKLPDGADLGWSYDRRRRLWRFVIRTEDDAWDLLACSREERAEVFTSGAMGKLVAQMRRLVDANLESRPPEGRR